MTSVLQVTPRRMLSLRRHFSSTPSTSSPAKTRLPAEKMRPLVSLYHEAETFITPGNLSDMIDAAFIYRPHEGSDVRSKEDPIHLLRADVDLLKRLPKISEASLVSVDQGRMDAAEGWSERRLVRERKVMNALYGVEANAKPGVEALEEEADNIRAILQRNKTAPQS